MSKNRVGEAESGVTSPQTSPEPTATPAAAATFSGSGSGDHLSHVPRVSGVTHEHVVITGRNVDVAEDDCGVAELFLE